MAEKIIAITDCDHPTVDIEKKIISENGFQAVVHQCKSEGDVLKHCQDADGIIVQYAPITRRVLASLPKCKVIANYGVGFDNIDVTAATDLGIQVCNVPDYGYEEVSDHALGLILNVSRKIDLLSTHAKNNIWDFRIARPIRRLKDQTLGVLGLGGIGLTLARKAQALGWHVIGHSRKAKRGTGIKTVSFEQLLALSDILSIHLPLNQDTYHLFNKELFRKMKKGALLINTSRGAIINEDDLVEALKTNQIGGAGLDVMEKEPPQENHPLYSFDNVVITPHSAFYSEESLAELKQKAAEEACAYLLNKQIRYPVNTIRKKKT